MIPVLLVSIARNASLMALKSMSMSPEILLTMNFKVSNGIYFGARKSLIFWTIVSLAVSG